MTNVNTGLDYFCGRTEDMVMTGFGYAARDVGERGPKPKYGSAKKPFSTKLPPVHKAFLDSLPNKAGWLADVIDGHADFLAWREQNPPATSESTPEHARTTRRVTRVPQAARYQSALLRLRSVTFEWSKRSAKRGRK